MRFKQIFSFFFYKKFNDEIKKHFTRNEFLHKKFDNIARNHRTKKCFIVIKHY